MEEDAGEEEEEGEEGEEDIEEADQDQSDADETGDRMMAVVTFGESVMIFEKYLWTHLEEIYVFRRNWC